MPRYYARRRRRPQSSRSVGACRRPDAPYGRTPRSLKVLGQHLEGGQPNSSVRRRRTSRRDVVLTCRDASRRVLNRVGCCCLHSHSHAFTDDRRAPDRLTCPPQAHPRPPRRSSPRRSSSSPLALVLHAIRSADGFPQQHIFHDELDLDGNGHIEAHELELALQKAGACVCKTGSGIC